MTVPIENSRLLRSAAQNRGSVSRSSKLLTPTNDRAPRPFHFWKLSISRSVSGISTNRARSRAGGPRNTHPPCRFQRRTLGLFIPGSAACPEFGGLVLHRLGSLGRRLGTGHDLLDEPVHQAHGQLRGGLDVVEIV